MNLQENLQFLTTICSPHLHKNAYQLFTQGSITIIDSKLSFVYFTNVDFIVLYYVGDILLLFTEENPNGSKCFNSCRGGSRIPHRRERQPSRRGRQPMILPKFSKNCMKLRKFWALGEGRAPGAPPLDSPLS